MSENQPPKDNMNEPQGISRRGLFSILGSAPAVAAITATVALADTPEQSAMHHAAAAAAPKGPYVRKIFDEHQWKTVHVLGDLIIPADDRSVAASKAGVPEFIDDWLDFRNTEDGNENFSAQILGGLVWIDHESNHLFEHNFADATADQQKQILDRIAWPARAAKEDQIWAAFFSRFRDLVVSGFFSSKTGVADLPYLGNRAVAEWKGCDPKVWAVIEQRMKNGYKGLGGESGPMLG